MQPDDIIVGENGGVCVRDCLVARTSPILDRITTIFRVLGTDIFDDTDYGLRYFMFNPMKGEQFRMDGRDYYVLNVINVTIYCRMCVTPLAPKLLSRL